MRPVGEAVQASIVIVNYNGGEKLLRCLAAACRTASADCEIIVVDNASDDRSADAVAAQFPDLRLIRSRSNLGFGGGNNLGVRSASGRYLIFLNPDTSVEPGWIEALLEPLEREPGAGLSTAKVLLLDSPQTINTCGNNVHFTGLALCRGLGSPREALNEPEEVDAVSGAAFAIRHELFNELGGFDEDTFLYMEDTDLSLRARLAGWRCLFAPDSVVYHEYRLKITPFKLFYQERNRYLMLLKSLRWPTLLILLPSLAAAELLAWGFVVLRDRAHLRNKILAYRWVLQNWADILRKRRATQRLRRVNDRAVLRRSAYRLDYGQVGGVPAGIAHLLFDPLFFVLRTLTLAVVWW